MKSETDPFEPPVVVEVMDTFAELSRRPAVVADAAPSLVTGAVTARFHGFNLDERPLLTGLPGLHHEIVAARSTTRLTRSQIGSTVVAICEEGDARRPIVLGVLQEQPAAVEAPREKTELPQSVSVQVDDDRLVLSAERQIVLKCGDASITLTRAGKVLITGSYVLSRSTGYNKIKGAAVDIN